MTVVGIAVNGSRPRAVELAREASAWLRERGHEVRLPKPDAGAAGLDDLGVEPDALRGIGVMVALGGDGTILRAVHLAVPFGAPVLGVDLGRLAYLSAVIPERLCDALERFVAGDFRIEERTMLAAGMASAHGVREARLALNEAVLEHAGPGHTVHLAVHIADRFFTSHVADALIVATPTGSTAYAFSAGGPIVSPRHDALLVTPVAPHTPFTRSLVLHADEPVRVEVLDHRGAVLSIDGQEVGRLGQGDALTASVAPTRAKFVTFGEREFYDVLKVKFGLADR